MINRQLFITALLFTLHTPAMAAKKTTIEEHNQTYSVGLGLTRLIYQTPSQGVILPINNPNDYPVLVQSTVTTEKKDGETAFVVTPPLFRLDPQQKTNVRVMMVNGDGVTDVEKLYWFCATGIPPKSGDAWSDTKEDVATINVKVKMKQCIKLLVRPAGLKLGPQQSASLVTWHRDGDMLVGENPTPFYINFKTLSLGNTLIPIPDYISPKGTTRYPLPKGHSASSEVKWQVINDIGGVSQTYTAQAR